MRVRTFRGVHALPSQDNADFSLLLDEENLDFVFISVGCSPPRHPKQEVTGLLEAFRYLLSLRTIMMMMMVMVMVVVMVVG